MMRALTFLQAAIAIVVLATVVVSPNTMAYANEVIFERPNILVVMVDDLGFSDIGCYGGEIDTPNLDQLADDGLRLSQFYSTAKCHSSRISLLTGRYAFQAGNTSLKRAVTSAEVLGDGGYVTAMTGKWHLDEQPTDFGFQRYFGHLSGACNYYTGDKTFRLNGEPWHVPSDGFYTTVANVDFALQFLKEARQSKKPWYLYVAFNAPHAPLQPLEEDYKKYLDRYDVGWDVIRELRVKKQTELKLFGGPVRASPRPDHVPAWDALSKARQRFESRRMAAYAGMIDRVDQELGRLFDDLRHVDEMDDTLILFVSDNGACPYDRRSNNIDGNPFDADTRWSDSTGWAWARNSPFRYYKQNQFEGGIATPAIVHWPAGLKAPTGSIVHDPAHLIDVFPTLAEVAGVQIPSEWPGRELEPVAGVSLTPVLRGRELGARPPIHLLFSTDRGLRDGDWKLVSFRSLPWELYNIAQDRAELHNVAADHPEMVERMAKQWRDMCEHVVKAPAKSYQPVKKEPAPDIHSEWTDFGRDPEEASPRRRRAGSAPVGDRIRARKDTQMQVEGDTLLLTCTGTDSGIAIDRIVGIESAGPYTVALRLKANAGDSGELFFTTDAQTRLPDGVHVRFPIVQDGGWHDIQLKLDTTERVFAIRLDPGDKPGKAVIQGLSLKATDGTLLKQWPRFGADLGATRSERN